MPVKETPLKGGKVRVSTPNGVKAKATTKAKADKQTRLLNAIDHNPGFVPHKDPPPSVRLTGAHAKKLKHLQPGKAVHMTVHGKLLEHGIDEHTGQHHARIQVSRVSPASKKAPFPGAAPPFKKKG